ncbi:site-specific integrase [Limosilactobacillus reuteri]|uniref:Site-specific integrase n=1 Tax=Limosilactobacillus reuteri TaxID=1598 RepID=A0AAW4X6L7_LIMRT|nr:MULTISPECIES: site-specific integrase [Limosilactobacillus]MCC4478084.1 site-specific integrase [Limosilactobacillus reuteri]MCC4480409.1 site-specific integrase [Limosilactobacillus reuteri]MCC4489319.1 site-specific integrase [Limosilactobacillus reuteri]MCC4493219.1 site-specific integrase [Limosilactobacillus reuteri]MCC4495807.1 site-specific integrase [Limosilactobacillus reuteri]
MKQLVLPIKDSNILHEVQDTLLNNFRYGRRNYTIFQVGKATLLRVSDVLALRRNEIFNDDGTIKKNAYIRDKKTDKPNTLYLKPVNQDLIDYLQWLNENKIQSDWLFPSIKHPDRHITEKQYYKVMAKTGDLLGINYLGTHTMRKTGAYRVYTQTHYNIGLVMSLLNHSSEAMTLKYLGLDQVSREQMLDKVSFD